MDLLTAPVLPPRSRLTLPPHRVGVWRLVQSVLRRALLALEPRLPGGFDAFVPDAARPLAREVAPAELLDAPSLSLILLALSRRVVQDPPVLEELSEPRWAPLDAVEEAVLEAVGDEELPGLSGGMRGLLGGLGDDPLASLAGLGAFAPPTEALLRAQDAIAEVQRVRGPGPGEPQLPGPAHDPEAEAAAYTPDRPWMPDVVVVAKHLLVWMKQLSQRFGRPVETLADIPDQALDELAARGFTGLWLIGLWQRSSASAKLKHHHGDHGAVASAYSLIDYQVAEHLGGGLAWADLNHRALQRGIRLGADLVPNHTGLDSRWIVEHPDWFVQTDHPPYPNYRFDTPDLSGDPRVSVHLERGYFDRSDAAVVYRLRDATGKERFVFHGNDGTSMPWNDTAQLDFTKAEVREAVIQLIVDVAARFPILRLDAAMVLARRHVRRLWHPRPGEGGAVPSRSWLGLSDAQFDETMPGEFWREVVDRINEVQPETLLMAEAFWMLEGYFVRTLGMHRVYNSAFMHMLRDQDGAKHRGMWAEFLASTPGVLERFVNFLSNPDEEPCTHQFGKGDKYFGAATLLATMPGTPMFGHGQMEGLQEQYGMEFTAPRIDEDIDAGFLSWHEAVIVPLLKRRRLFSQVEHFELFDLVRDDGSVAQDVYAIVNGFGDERALVLVNMSHEPASGRLHESLPKNVGSEDEPNLRRTHIADALGVHGLTGFRDQRSGHRLVVHEDQLRQRGLFVELPAYGYAVRWERELLQDERLGKGAWLLDGKLAEDLEAVLLVAGVSVPQARATDADGAASVVDEPPGQVPGADEDESASVVEPPPAPDEDGGDEVPQGEAPRGRRAEGSTGSEGGLGRDATRGSAGAAADFEGADRGADPDALPTLEWQGPPAGASRPSEAADGEPRDGE